MRGRNDFWLTMTDFPDARADRSFFESVGKAEVPGTYSGNREASIKERLQSKRRRRRKEREDIGQCYHRG